MRKLIITTIIIAAIAIVAPELRALLFVGIVSALSGFMVGSQRKAVVDAELTQARAVRLELSKG